MKVKNKPAGPGRVKFKTRPDDEMNQLIKWWEVKSSNEKAAAMLTYAANLKEMQSYRYRQAAVYARLYGNQSLYSFAGNNMSKMDQTMGLPQERPTFNIVQACIDTLVSRITQSRPQPIFLTDNSDYKERNAAKKFNSFIQGEFYQTKAYEKGVLLLRDACVIGDGCLHVFESPDNKVAIERVLSTELLIDPNEALYGEPRRMYRLKLVDRDVLMANFPNKRKMLEEAAKSYPDNTGDGTKSVSDLVMIVEAWSLPSGKDMGDGRHVLAVSSGALLDEEYDKPRFPFVFLHYSPRMLGLWAQGLAEQLMGTQMELNSLLFTISRSIKLAGVPRVFIEEGSKVSGTSFNNEIGTLIKYRGTKPEVIVQDSNAPDLYAERDKLIQYGFQQCGVSALQASSQKPAGLNSGEAIRSYDDISNDRFAALAKRYDNMFIDLAYQIMDIAGDIAKRDGKYQTVYPNKNGCKEINLTKADFLKDDFIIQCYTQSSLPKDPAGRLQKITEMMQAGMISIQEGRRLLDYPDLEQVEKLANASEERIFKILDDIVEDGKYTPPDEFMNLDLAIQLCVQYINLYTASKLEEDRAQLLRDFFNRANDLKTMSNPQPTIPQGAVPQANPEPAPTNPMIPNSPNPQPIPQQ